jgi:ankyrin repeat protein
MSGMIPLWFACSHGRLPVARLLLERGADPTIATDYGVTALMTASFEGHLEVVRFLLDHPSAKSTINHRDGDGFTALQEACYMGRGAVARALLWSGADPAIADRLGDTPMTTAKQDPDEKGISVEGRRECVAVLEVSFSHHTLFCPFCRAAG